MYSLKRFNLKPVAFAFAAAAVTVVPIYALIALLIDWWPKPAPSDLVLPPILLAINVLVIAPVIETYLMVPVLFIFNKITNTDNWSVLLTAIFFSLLHYLFDLNNPIVVPVITWGFFVYGKTLIHCKEKRPDSYLWIVMLTHSIANFVTMATQWL